MRRALVLLLSLVVPPLAAQSAGAGRPGPRPLLPAMEEMVLARSAAPASVAAGARIWVLTGAGWVIGDSGTTTAACLVGRSWPAALEPATISAWKKATRDPDPTLRAVARALLRASACSRSRSRIVRARASRSPRSALTDIPTR